MRARSCPTIWDLMDCSPPASSVHGIFQAKILQRLAISFSRGSFQTRDQTCGLLRFLHWQLDSLPAEPPLMPSFLDFECKYSMCLLNKIQARYERHNNKWSIYIGVYTTHGGSMVKNPPAMQEM